MPLDRVHPGEDHRFQLLESRKRLRRRPRRLGDGVANLRVLDGLDVRGEEPDLAGGELFDRRRFWREHSDRLDRIVLGGRHQPDLHAWLQDAVEHADDDDDAAI